MSVLYADASALARAYLSDELEYEVLSALLLEGDEPVATSELARLELASASAAAARAGRLAHPSQVLDRFEVDCGADALITLIELDPPRIFPRAYDLIREHRLRTLDAVHLTVALEEAPSLAGDGTVVLVTRDEDQAIAARALGLEVR